MMKKEDHNMIAALLLLFFVIFGCITYVSLSIIRNNSNNIDLENYSYTPNINIGDLVKIVNKKESPDILSKTFEVTRISDETLFLKGPDDSMITKNINEVEKLYNFK